jgi:hypothetical protein
VNCREVDVRRLISLAAPVPALVVGAFIMRHHGVAAPLWGLNLAVGIAGLAICAVVTTRPRAEHGRRGLIVLAVAALVMLALTFVDAGISGVHRWLQLGPVTLYAGAVALPMLIIAMNARWGMLVAVATAIILVAQPDAAQAAALAMAMIVLMIQRSARDPRVWLAALAVVALAAWPWFRTDPLAPVPHVEGILGLAREAGLPWLSAAIASLLLLPLPFFVGNNDSITPLTRALGAYIAVCILVPLVRAFPVPLLGFGVSPIIGYFIALSAVRRP